VVKVVFTGLAIVVGATALEGRSEGVRISLGGKSEREREMERRESAMDREVEREGKSEATDGKR
jgi:hypothetical protein